jgi:IS5 family transposase
MKLFEPLTLKFEQANWARNPEFGLIDTILETHPDLIRMTKEDITAGCDEKQFGRKDTPSVEQIVRAALYKEIKNLDYRELEFAQEDSRICEQFVKINRERPYCFQVYQKYISRIKAETLEKLMVALNKIAIGEGLEDVSQFRQDSTVIETNIHYPTNNSLVWDCVKESHRLLSRLQEEITILNFTDYRRKAKRTSFKINVTKGAEGRIKLFQKQLKLFTECINQVSNIVKKKSGYEGNIVAGIWMQELEGLLPLMEKVYQMTYRRELLGEQVPVNEKIVSIYEVHTDIIVKGKREVKFGHKVNLGGGKSNMILTCKIERGNPKDSELFIGTIERVIGGYGTTPKSSVTDGGYASRENQEYAESKKITNIVFTKIAGSLKNICKNKRVENKLKRWRSGMEAVISNLKRGFEIRRCDWKEFEHYRQKVFWSVIAYNFRVMTGAVLANLKLSL